MGKQTDANEHRPKITVFGIIQALILIPVIIVTILEVMAWLYLSEEGISDKQLGIRQLRVENPWLLDYNEVVDSAKAEKPVKGEVYYVCQDQEWGYVGSLLVEDSEHNRKYITHYDKDDINAGDIVTYTGSKYKNIGYWNTQPQLEVDYIDSSLRWGNTNEVEPGDLFYVRDSMMINYRVGAGKHTSFVSTQVLILEDSTGVKYQITIGPDESGTPYTSNGITSYDSKIVEGDIVRYRGYKLFSIEQSAWDTFSELEERPYHEKKTTPEMLAKLNWDELPEQIKHEITFQ